MALFSNMPKTTFLIINLIITIFCITLCCNTYTSLAYASPQSLPNHNIIINKRVSTIAAEPSVLPYYSSPLSSPTTSYALSPDISPLFPTTPKSSSNAPSSDSSSPPIIPASPSPPNPDDSLSTPHPDFSMAPTASMPESSAFAFNVCLLLHSTMILLLTFFFW